ATTRRSSIGSTSPSCGLSAAPEPAGICITRVLVPHAEGLPVRAQGLCTSAHLRLALVCRLARRLHPLDLNSAVLQQRHERTDRREHRRQHRADDPGGQRKLRNGASLMLDDDAPYVAFANELLDLVDDALGLRAKRFVIAFLGHR